MISWPSRALGAIVKLFEPLQDIDIYVEDSNDEVFYTNLFKRISENQVRIAKVFPKGNRQAVVDAALKYTSGSRKSLFVIDGDLEWVKGLPPPANLKCLHRIEAYCVENLLIDENAIVKIFVQEMVLNEEEAKEKLAFSEWVLSIETLLIELFSAYATVSFFDPTYRTVSSGVGNLCTQLANGKPILDPQKVKDERDRALEAAKKVASKRSVTQYYDKIYANAKSLAFPLDIVSGKDFLLPLLEFVLHGHSCKMRRKSFRFKLALFCNTSRFTSMQKALQDAVQ